MVLNLNKSFFYFLVIGFLTVSMSMLFPFILPEKFFFDSKVIILDRYNEIGLIGSYAFSIWFYKITGLKYLDFSLVGLIQTSIVIYLIFVIGIPKSFHKLNIKNIIVYFSFLMLAIFLCMPTKEFINFVYISMIIFLFNKKKYGIRKTVFLGLLSIAFFGVFFRPYFIIIATLVVGMYLISFVNFKYKRVANIFYGLMIVIGVSLSYGLLKGVFISQKTREGLNISRVGSENANSLIMSPIPTNSWYGESFGIIYGFFSVNLPINGLRFLLKPQIIAFVIWQLILFIVLYHRFGDCLRKGKKNNYELWLFYFLFSYFIVQGVFEPDLGSSVRHKIGMFPLIYYLLYYEDFRKTLSKNI